MNTWSFGEVIDTIGKGSRMDPSTYMFDIFVAYRLILNLSQASSFNL